VTIALQVPSGDRLVAPFPSTLTLEKLVEKWKVEVGEGKEGEEPVIVYMRREVAGQKELERTTLRSLGLVSGKGLLRFFYKAPELLKSQANVYNLKVVEKEVKEEKRHLPMRLEAATISKEKELEEEVEQDKMEEEEVVETEVEEVQSSIEVGEVVADERMEEESSTPTLPDSSTKGVEAIIKELEGGALVYRLNEEMGQRFSADQVEDDFFELSIEEVKSMYKDLRQEVKKMDEGAALQTRDMRETQEEEEKLSVISRYKTGVLRIQLPDRHIVQGQFAPETTIQTVMTWLSPFLVPGVLGSGGELYTSPPRTSLDFASTLLDLGLFPAALVHLSPSDLCPPSSQFLTDNVLDSLSNAAGAQEVAARARGEARSRSRGNGKDSSGKRSLKESSESVESEAGVNRTEKKDYSRNSSKSSDGQKVPKWFKPGK